ncbi:hypothetical protein E5288_WYG012125 [Bos mutus]|uniref:Homeobox domain-containing protein n=1 Tax=Bos mutus TaxID=72004 RepID=A0A6B0R8G0_9CETA|nr:hypothetical protein [Bos mutus]
MTGAISYHPYGSAAYPYQLNDPAYRKNATRDATATLKAWLNEHRKNPYPTKGEKIMLAIITKMTLTQVSTWFANARRRLKKENKMTWAPRNKSEDEDEDEGDAARGKEESADKAHEGTETSAEDEDVNENPVIIQSPGRNNFKIPPPPIGFCPLEMGEKQTVPGFLFRFDEIRIYTAGSNAMRRRDADGPCGSFSPEDCEDS